MALCGFNRLHGHSQLVRITSEFISGLLLSFTSNRLVVISSFSQRLFITPQHQMNPCFRQMVLTIKGNVCCIAKGNQIICQQGFQFAGAGNCQDTAAACIRLSAFQTQQSIVRKQDFAIVIQIHSSRNNQLTSSKGTIILIMACLAALENLQGRTAVHNQIIIQCYFAKYACIGIIEGNGIAGKGGCILIHHPAGFTAVLIDKDTAPLIHMTAVANASGIDNHRIAVCNESTIAAGANTPSAADGGSITVAGLGIDNAAADCDSSCIIRIFTGTDASTAGNIPYCVAANRYYLSTCNSNISIR